MNIFDNYLSEINQIILRNKDILNLKNLENLNEVNLEVPPDQFNFDLSSNISLVLAKQNKIKPNSLANLLKDLLLKGPLIRRAELLLQKDFHLLNLESYYIEYLVQARDHDLKSLLWLP